MSCCCMSYDSRPVLGFSCTLRGSSPSARIGFHQARPRGVSSGVLVYFCGMIGFAVWGIVKQKGVVTVPTDHHREIRALGHSRATRKMLCWLLSESMDASPCLTVARMLVPQRAYVPALLYSWFRQEILTVFPWLFSCLTETPAEFRRCLRRHHAGR